MSVWPRLPVTMVAHGADPLLPTNEKTTPLMMAAGMGYVRYVQGQSVGSESNRLDAVTLAWELGADLHAVNDAGETAMHGAATGGANSVVLSLVEKGAQLDVKSKQGWTPLTIAVVAGHAVAIEHGPEGRGRWRCEDQ